MLECANGNYQDNPPTYPGLVCDINVKESGTMTSLTRINGVQHTDSITVYCLDSIPLLNHEKVRQGLLAALDSSGVGGPVPFQEIERLYFIVQDTVTPGAEPYVKIFPQLPGADGCRAAGWNEPPDFSDRPANTKLIAWGHTHPGLFSFCHDRNGQIIKDENGNDDLLYHPPGVSDGDIFQFEKRNDPNRYPQYVGPVYQYVIDQQRLWIMKPWQLSQAANNLPANHPPWRTGQFAWPKKRV